MYKELTAPVRQTTTLDCNDRTASTIKWLCLHQIIHIQKSYSEQESWCCN